MNDAPVLRELGMDDKEAAVYLCCLRYGSVNVKTIAERTGIIRTTAYGILRALLRKGHVSIVRREGIQSFQATSPRELLRMIEQKRERLIDEIPHLERLRAATPVTHKAEIFEGREGVKAIVDDLLALPNQTVKMISVGKRWIEFSETFTNIYYRKKRERNVRTKTILADTAQERRFAKSGKPKNSEFRFLKGISTKGTWYIYADKVAFATYEDETAHGFIIQDAEFHALQEALFDESWARASK